MQKPVISDEGKRRRPKSANGNGGARKRPDGTWEWRVSLPDGRRVSAATARTKRRRVNDVSIRSPWRIRASTIERRERRSTTSSPGGWRTWRPRCSAKTLRTYTDLVRLHVAPELGRTRDWQALRATSAVPAQEEGTGRIVAAHRGAHSGRGTDGAQRWGTAGRGGPQCGATDRPTETPCPRTRAVHGGGSARAPGSSTRRPTGGALSVGAFAGVAPRGVARITLARRRPGLRDAPRSAVAPAGQWGHCSEGAENGAFAAHTFVAALSR